MAVRFRLPEQEISVVNTFVHFREEATSESEDADEIPFCKRLGRRAATAPVAKDQSSESDGNSTNSESEEEEKEPSLPSPVPAHFQLPKRATNLSDTSGSTSSMLSVECLQETPPLPAVCLPFITLPGSVPYVDMNQVIQAQCIDRADPGSAGILTADSSRITITPPREMDSKVCASTDSTSSRAPASQRRNASPKRLTLEEALPPPKPRQPMTLLAVPMLFMAPTPAPASWPSATDQRLRTGPSAKQSVQSGQPTGASPAPATACLLGRMSPACTVNGKLDGLSQMAKLQHSFETRQPKLQTSSSQPPALVSDVLPNGKERIRWSVDARKLESHDTKVLSPEFYLRLPTFEAPQPFRLMVLATESLGRGGGSFRKAGGKGRIALKCESSVIEGMATMFVKVLVGNPGSLQYARGPFFHNFADWCCCNLQKDDEDWNLKSVVDSETKRFEICLEVLDESLAAYR